jgi:hypothetical protein
MRERLMAQRRVLRVHELIEEMREAELLRAVTEMREVERTVATQRTIAELSAMGWRNALFGDDRIGASVSAVQQRSANWREELLLPVLSERKHRSEVSRERHLDSRQWTERMRWLAKQTEESLEEMEERRLQRESDDRYLSRQRWAQSKSGTPDVRR